MAWLRWEKVCRPKCLGGLGFHDLGFFNQSLVAKQVWRLLKNKESLAFCVLKGKYFHNSSIHEVEDKTSSSYLWKSFLWGRALLKDGLRWKISSGFRVNLLLDP